MNIKVLQNILVEYESGNICVGELIRDFVTETNKFKCPAKIEFCTVCSYCPCRIK